jgi:hypothetical protein
MFLPGVAVVRQAAAALGWIGEPVRVRFGGEDAWAVASLTTAYVGALAKRNTSGPSSTAASTVEIFGVIVAGTAGSRVAVRASVFAGYSPRAVLVPDGPGVLGAQVAAAMLGQGVVVASDSRVRLLSGAEPTQLGIAGPADAARRRLAEQVYDGLVGVGPSQVC